MNFNKVLLAGNLTRDPELKHVGESAVCGFSIAVNEKWTDSRSGEKKESVSFIDCEAWGKTAESIAKYFNKGKPIFVEGKMKQDTWEDKTDGSKRSKIKVNVLGFQFVGSKSDGEGEAPSPNRKLPGIPAERPILEPIQEEDIPF